MRAARPIRLRRDPPTAVGIGLRDRRGVGGRA